MSDRFRIIVDDSYRFANDEVLIKIAMRTRDGYRPITFSFDIGEEIPSDVTTPDDAITVTALPRELAELMLSAFARYFLSAEGDVVITNRRLKQELERVTKQLESLIAGIGKLGGTQ